MTLPTHDVAIVGGGPAGLATAYHLRESGLSVRVLESTSDVGGRALSVDLAQEQVNTGAMFVYRDTPTHALAEQLGVALEPFRPDSYGVHLDGVTVVSRDNDDLVDRLPLSAEEKVALRAFVHRTVAMYRSQTVSGRLQLGTPDLGRLPADSQLGDLPPRARMIVETAIRGGSVAKASQLSATYALRYFASYLAHEHDNRLVALDGMQSICRAIAAALPADTVCVDSPVTRVGRNGDGTWAVWVRQATSLVALTARQVVMAVPAPLIGALCDLPAWKADALGRALTPGSTTLSVVADVSDLSDTAGAPFTPSDVSADMDAWSFVVTPGLAFDAIINPRPGRADGRIQLVCYGNSVGYVPEVVAGDPARVRAWTRDLLTVAPQLRGRVLGAHLQTWEHCFSLLTPERGAVIDQLREPVHETLHFAGDYCSETAGTHGAFAEAARVASTIVG